MEKVSVSRGFLIGVVGVAAAALLALAFALGRESGTGSVAAPSTRIQRIAPPAPRAQDVSPPPPTSSTRIMDRLEAWVAGPAPSGPVQGAATQTAASQVPPALDGERAAVAAYFDAVERIQAGAANGDPNGIAQEMAAALANGDTSALDKMIRETEAAKTRLAAIPPPAPCAAHYRESVGSLDDALEVLRSLKAAMESSEPVAQLANVTTRATALRSRAEALQKEELALRERYGLKR
ncbi:MAG: hypothetical protein ABI584_05295 [Acidobacteriota bacterium]